MDETIFTRKINVGASDDLICEMTFRKKSIQRVPTTNIIPLERRWDNKSLLCREAFSENGINRS